MSRQLDCASRSENVQPAHEQPGADQAGRFRTGKNVWRAVRTYDAAGRNAMVQVRGKAKAGRAVFEG